MDKKQAIQNLIKTMGKDLRCESLYEKDDLRNMVNQFHDNTFIPNKWFDWGYSSDAKIMIIGQDWGPYSVLYDRYITKYNLEVKKKDFDYDRFLLDSFSSRTEKFIIQSIKDNYLSEKLVEMELADWNKYFFTMAVLFCRSGTLFRGINNFDADSALELSLEYLKQQIDIIKPTKIMTLGDMALRQIYKIYGITDDRRLTQIISTGKNMYISGMEIIPNFHPASHVDPKIISEKFKQIVV